MKADFSLDYDVLTMERPHQVYMMARFIGGSSPDGHKRRPLNLSLIIDRSGSMAGEKIDYTRQAAQFMVQNLSPKDHLSVVLYNDKVETLIEPGLVVNKDAITQKIEKIRISGTTNLSGGWLQGCTHVEKNFSDQKVNRVILMSDGLANRGVTDTNKLVSMVSKRFALEAISTTTMGLGTDFNEDLMMAMANAGGGAFYFIESPEAAPTIFNEELRGLLSVVGQNLTITVTTTDHVSQIKQLNAYPDFTDKNVYSYRLGDVYGDEEKTLILELDIPALQTLGETEIATLKFDYDELTTDGASEHHVWEMPVNVNVQSTVPEPVIRDSNVMENVLLLKAANARREAIKNADKGKYKQATEALKKVIDDIDDAGIENDQIKEERSALESQAKQMEEGPEAYDNYSRKTMSTQAMYTLTSRHDETIVLRRREILREFEKRGVPMDDDGNVILMSTPEVEKPDTLKVRENVIPPTYVTVDGKTIPLDTNLLRIGRSSHNEIHLQKTGVSRFHAHLKRVGEGYIIEDLGSTNGTIFNNKPIFGSMTLSVGDEIMICNEKLIFHAGGATV
jgi:Ca-activated chloride channel homolog